MVDDARREELFRRLNDADNLISHVIYSEVPLVAGEPPVKLPGRVSVQLSKSLDLIRQAKGLLSLKD